MSFESRASQKQNLTEVSAARSLPTESPASKWLPAKLPGALPDAFWEAIEQFNAREYYACHETLERLWIPERGGVRELYQGIIQIAVGCHHLTVRHNVRGAISLLERGARRLEKALPFESSSEKCRFDTVSGKEIYSIDWRNLIVMSDELRQYLKAGDAENPEQVEHALLPRIFVTREPHKSSMNYIDDAL